MQITYGSVCSGIEAASNAWEPLGMRPEWFSEIEDFPSAVLAHHWPHIVNLGDMTKIAAAVRAGDVSAPDILVGGTPCQAFSVAGARKGLADSRGQLTISYGELADAIDDTRTAAGRPETIIVWENVPGVLSSKDNAFGAFLGLLAGEECELQPPGGKWKNAGYVRGPKRVLAWIVKDAQFFGVAQRRRRVFVVASARADFDPAKVLFESEGVCRDTAPSRGKGSAVAALTANGVGTCGADDNQGQAGHLIPQCVAGDVAHTLKAEGFDGSEDGTGRGTPIIGAYRMTAFGEYADDETASTCKARDYKDATDLAVMAVHGTQDPGTSVELAHALGRNNGAENAVFCFSSKDHGADAADNLAPTLRAGNSIDSNQNAGAPPAVAYSLQHAQIGRKDTAGPQGKGWQEEVGFTLDSRPEADVVAVAFAENSRAEIRLEGGDGQICGVLSTGGGKPGQGRPVIAQNMAVRRLTPVECERLQGFPDNWTNIPVSKRKKITDDELVYLRHHFPEISDEEACRLAADGPRYKAIGNSMAVPCMAFIGRRILQQLEAP